MHSMVNTSGLLLLEQLHMEAFLPPVTGVGLGTSLGREMQMRTLTMGDMVSEESAMAILIPMDTDVASMARDLLKLKLPQKFLLTARDLLSLMEL